MQNNSTDYDVLIANYLDNSELSVKDKEALWNWVNASATNRTYFTQMSKAWEKSIIEIDDKSRARYLLEQKAKQRQQQKTRTLYRRTMSAAAVLIFVIVGALFFNSDLLGGKKMQLAESGSTKREILLPDGSIVWLNARSTLKYPSKFKRKREVYLNGEAYFDVKNNKKPFSVISENITIEVKGTSFLVTDREGSNHCETVLETGLVNLTINSLGKKIEMTPNQQVIYDKETGETSVNKVNATDYTGWRANRLVFENTLLSDVFIQLEKWYNKEIICTDNNVLNTPVSFTVDEESIDEILSLLQHITNITWQKTSDNKILIQ